MSDEVVGRRAWRDVVPEDPTSASPGSASFDVDEFAVLADGRRVLLHHGERGFGLSGPQTRTGGPIGDLTAAEIESGVLATVLPDEDDARSIRGSGSPTSCARTASSSRPTRSGRFRTGWSSASDCSACWRADRSTATAECSSPRRRPGGPPGPDPPAGRGRRLLGPPCRSRILVPHILPLFEVKARLSQIAAEVHRTYERLASAAVPERERHDLVLSPGPRRALTELLPPAAAVAAWEFHGIASTGAEVDHDLRETAVKACSAAVIAVTSM